MGSSSPRLLVLIITATALFASCGTPCKDLATAVCNCEPTELEQQVCIQRVESWEQTREVSAEDSQVCADILASGACTCDALAAGDLGACGLAITD